MEHRRLGNSGFMVPALTLGTGTFGGDTANPAAWGTSDVAEATRMVDICLEAGLTMFDSADVYNMGRSEEVLGAAIKGRRDRVLISTKATFAMGQGPNEQGSSRHWLTKAIDASLRRLGIDYIEADHAKLIVKFIRTPALGDVPYPVKMEPNLVVEYYAKN